LLKQSISGKTYDFFRHNGYDIVELYETDLNVDFKENKGVPLCQGQKHGSHPVKEEKNY